MISKKVLATVMILGLLSAGCTGRLKAWFCKLDLPQAEATISNGLQGIQSDYDFFVLTKAQLSEAIKLSPGDSSLALKLARVVNYLGLADQVLAIGFGILKDVQARICAPATAASLINKIGEAQAAKP